MSRQIYHLKVTLADVADEISRRIAVPGGYTLDRVHRAIQLAMGWQDCHLHSFEINSVQYGEPDPDALLELRDELNVRLDSVVTKDSRFTYVYDFGDWWEHDVLVEEVLAPEPDVRYPYCLEGERACPPEDVGGPPGYQHFLDAISNPHHPEHARLTQWLDRPFLPDAFDAGRVSAMMRRMV